MQALNHPLVSGETGCLADENAQRLLSIFVEAGMSCLQQLSSVVEAQLKAKAQDEKTFLKFYRAGLTSITQWNSTMLRAEISDMETHYPELQKLHQYVIVSILSEASYASSLSSLSIPPLEDAYHIFLKRLVSEADVQRGVAFLGMPLLYRKVVFVQAFRNAYHDLCQKYIPVAKPEQKHLLAFRSERAPEVGEEWASQSCASGEKKKASSLVEAMEVVSRGPARSAAAPDAFEPASAKDGSKTVFLHNSPATLLQEEAEEEDGEVASAPPPPSPERKQTPLQQGISSLRLQDKKPGARSEEPGEAHVDVEDQ